MLFNDCQFENKGKCVLVSYSFMKNCNVVDLTVPEKKFYCNKQEENLKRITGHMNI